MKNRVITIPLKPIYAIVRCYTDQEFNEDEQRLIIFYDKQEYEQYLENTEEEMIYTGLTFITLYIDKRKI